MMSDKNRLILGLEHFTSSKRSIYNNYFSLGRAFLQEQGHPLGTSIDMNKSALVGEFKSFLNDKTWLAGMMEWVWIVI